MTIYLTSADVARILGLTTGSVRLLQQRGALPIAAKTERGIMLYRRADVERLARAREASRSGKTQSSP
jgi:DNA-binding transcriptional MerR regulator